MSWALKNGQDLDEFLGKWRALGLENLNQTMRVGMWCVEGKCENRPNYKGERTSVGMEARQRQTIVTQIVEGLRIQAKESGRKQKATKRLCV